MRRAWAALASSGVEHPIAASSFAVAVTVLLALSIPSIRIDTSAEGFMVDRDPARVVYERFRQQFGTDSVTLVILRADDVFRPDVLAAVRRLTDLIEQLEGVVRVESLATARRVQADDDLIENRPLVGAEIPTAPDELAAVRDYALSHRVLVGHLVSADARATALVVYTDPERADSAFNRRFVEKLDALLAAEERPGLTVFEVGRPLLKRTYSDYILRDLIRLVPISSLVLVVVLLLFFRTMDAVVVPMLTVGSSVVWSLGMMALAGIPLNVVTAVIPTLLVTIGFTEDVHIIADYHSRLRSGLGRKDALKAAITETAAPILVTTVTTVVGFASLALSDVTMLVQFGYGSALALIGNYVATMAILPPAMLAVPVPRTATRGGPTRLGPVERRFHAFIEWLGWFDVRHRVAILVVAGVVSAAAIASLARIDVNTDFFSFFPEDAPIRARAREAHEVLTGAETFWVVVDTQRRDAAAEPELLDRIVKLQQYLAGTGLVDKTVSIADYVMTINRDLAGGRSQDERLPASREQVAQYLLLVDGPDLASLLNADASAAAILVRHNVSGSAPLAELRRRIDEYVASGFPPDVDVQTTGESILTNNAADYMAVNELTSFGFTFLAIAVIHSALFMSVRIGLLSLIPDLIPIVAVYGLMALLGVPLNSGTALIATIAIGISVDDTVHHLMTYAREIGESSHPSLAMFATLRKVGRPIVTASLALASGFLVLLGSGFVPLHQFGLFSALTMLIALVTELFVTPALLVSVRVVTVWDLVLLKIDPARLAASPCFRGFSQWQVRKVVLLGALRSYAPGACVARRGETGGGLFLIVTGRLRTTGGAHTATGDVLEPGAVFGELADGSAGWSVDLVAEQPSELLLLDFDSLERVRRRFPFTAAKLFRNVAIMLSTRLSNVSRP